MLVNRQRREIVGIVAIRRFFAKEFVGDHVDDGGARGHHHYGDIASFGEVRWDLDKTNLPEELVMSSYFSVRDDKIVSLAVIFNQPSEY